eukprot:5611113-Lingulodinium_polyedra.AAC.1
MRAGLLEVALPETDWYHGLQSPSGAGLWLWPHPPSCDVHPARARCRLACAATAPGSSTRL